MTTADSNEQDLYCVYRIYCTVTEKCYVGKTNNYEKRKKEHVRELKRGCHHSPKLQRAWNKYAGKNGERVFNAKIIESGISADKIDKHERYWIARYDSYRNGYNCTPGGDGRGVQGKPTPWNGVQYPSQSAAARAKGVALTTMQRWIAKGYTCDADVPEYEKPTPWNGIEYPSQREAARAKGVDPATMHTWIAKGYTCDDDVKRGRKRGNAAV